MEPSGSRYDSTRQAWEDIWSQADVTVELEALRETRTADQLGVFPAYLSKEGVILEAGVGLGATMIWLRAQGFRMIGLDYAINALRAARAYDPSLEMQAGDVHALPYRSASLHGYLSFGVLEHFEHGMGPALREAHRVLVPGGTLVLTIPYPNVVHRLVGLKRRLMGQGRLADEHFYESVYTQQDLIREVKAAGLLPVLVKPTSHAFTLWGLGGPFRAPGYYRASPLADRLGRVLRAALPWAFNFSTLVIARKAGESGEQKI